RNFIDYIIVNGINNPDTLPMDMFIPGKDGEAIQEYLSLYLKIRASHDEQSGEMIEKLLKMPEQHPYGNALALSYEISFVERGAISRLQDLQKQYPEDLHIANILIVELYQLGRYDEAQQLCEHFIVTNPEHGQLKYLYANVLAKKEKYDDAITQINDLMRNAGGNHQYLNELDQLRRQWNEKVIELKQQQMLTDPDDQQLKLDLGWAYLENDMYEKARDIVATVDREKADKFDYYNLSSAIAYTGKKYVQAIDALDNLIEVIQNLPQDGDAKTVKRKGRLGEMYGRKGSYMMAIDRPEDAMHYFELGLKSAKDKASILTSMIGASLNARDYLKAEKYARELILERSDAFHGYLFLAYSLFSQNRDPEAFDAVNHALNLSLDLESFILKGRILIRNNALDEAQEVISFLEENNLRDDPAVLYLNGLLNQQKDDAKTALEYYEKADAAIENSAIHPFTDDLYYQYLNLKGETLDARKEEDRKLMLEIAEKGLQADPHHYDLLDYKAWLLTRDRQYENALEIYRELLETPDHGPGIEAQIGYIYYQDLGKKAEQS
ncbi:MAG: tetratricopeptide repeat protein, partial [Erysipelotrichaceae bacterium]|nr:tetratricopeptide repeat protein [Erysipelotrichaceae bacterium]